MVVFGKNTTILDDTGKKYDVSPFTQDYQDVEKLSILDAAVE